MPHTTIFDPTHPKTTEVTFSFLDFVSVCKTPVYVVYQYVKHQFMLSIIEIHTDWQRVVVEIWPISKAVTYPGCLGAGYTSLGAQTLAPKKGFLTFYLKIFFKHPRRRVFRYSIYVI